MSLTPSWYKRECFSKASKYGSGAVIEIVFKIALCPSGQEGISFLPNYNIYVYFSEIPHYIAQNFILDFFTRLKESSSVNNLPYVRSPALNGILLCAYRNSCFLERIYLSVIFRIS